MTCADSEKGDRMNESLLTKRIHPISCRQGQNMQQKAQAGTQRRPHPSYKVHTTGGPMKYLVTHLYYCE